MLFSPTSRFGLGTHDLTELSKAWLEFGPSVFVFFS